MILQGMCGINAVVCTFNHFIIIPAIYQEIARDDSDSKYEKRLLLFL